jgi:septum formation protein
MPGQRADERWLVAAPTGYAARLGYGGGVVTVPRLVLASASPARRKLLAAAGIPADVMVSGVDESTVDSDRAEVLCLTLARLKAQWVAARLRQGQADHHRLSTMAPTGKLSALVLGCDSVLMFDGQVLGKPADEAEATQRWYAMRGRSGVLHTGHCLVPLPDGAPVEGVASTTVHFADLTDGEVAAYVASGEPLRVAGAFTIDGLGGPFVEAIEGDHSNVIGLSLPLLRRMLGELGIPLTDLWPERIASQV